MNPRSRNVLLVAAFVGALLSFAPNTARAALPAPLETDGATPEAQARTIEEQAERSLREKIAVGQERYQMRRQFRSTLVNGLRAQANRHSERILATNTIADPSPTAPPARGWPVPLWLILLTGFALASCIVLRKGPPSRGIGRPRCS